MQHNNAYLFNHLIDIVSQPNAKFQYGYFKNKDTRLWYNKLIYSPKQYFSVYTVKRQIEKRLLLKSDAFIISNY